MKPSRTSSPSPPSSGQVEVGLDGNLDLPHCLSVADVLVACDSSPDGLSDLESARRLVIHGPNDIEREGHEVSIPHKLLDAFKEPLIALLLFSASISLIIGEYGDAASIVLAVSFVTVMGVWQEHKSEKAIEELGKISASTCKVLREGSVSLLSSKLLVVGDVILIESGDRVPADVRLISTCELLMNEALLTGESVPVEKSTEPLPRLDLATHPLSERENIAFMGTTCVGGSGRGVVVAVGRDTELGNISKLIQGLESARTPLQEKMDEIGKTLTALALGIISVIFIAGIIQRRGILNMLNIGVSLAVAAIPEGLPIVVTITLAVGVSRMAGRHVIVRTLPVVEALGATTVICTDKTGTLTRNEMSVAAVYVDGGEIIPPLHSLSSLSPSLAPALSSLHPAPALSSLPSVVTPNASISQAVSSRSSHTIDSVLSNGKAISTPQIERLFIASVLCNNAAETRTGHYVGHPTDIALFRFARTHNIPDLRVVHHRISEEPFSSFRKMMSVEYSVGGTARCYVKGAVESVLNHCSSVYSSSSASLLRMTSDTRRSILGHAQMMGNASLRVLAVAEGPSRSDSYTFLGLIGLRDPLKDGVQDAMKKCLDSGVHVIMLTGDSKETAVHVAEELGIFEKAKSVAMSAQELQAMSDFDLASQIDRIKVFYRVSPDHKLKIVNALISAGHTVAMTGDGVNDAPALKRAHIGVSMGKSGSEVAKEASHMILLDDSFASIHAAILEGKTIFCNILSFLRYQLTTSLSCLLVIFLSSLLGLPIPMNPTQILWINILMDGPPAQSLGLEPLDPELEFTPPRNREDRVFSPGMIFDIFSGSVVMIFGTLSLFWMELTDLSHAASPEMDQKRAMTIAFNTFVFFQIFNAFNCKSHSHTFFRRQSFGNRFFWYAISLSVMLQMGAIYVPFLQSFFLTLPLTRQEMVMSILVASSVLFVDEIGKYVSRKSGVAWRRYR